MMIFGPVSLMFYICATIYELFMGIVAPPKVKTKMVNGVNGINGVHYE